MIILPHTPPTVVALNAVAAKFPSSLSSQRSALVGAPATTYSELVRYAVDLQDYLESIFAFLVHEADNHDVDSCVSHSAEISLAEVAAVPWANAKFASKPEEKSILKKSKRDWTLSHEIELVVVSLSLVYTRIGSELVNELIDAEESPEAAERWKQVVTFYKKALSFLGFGRLVNSKSPTPALSGELYAFLEKTNQVSIQMSILSKSSWVNRCSFNFDETFKTTNNGTLCRVAVFVVGELNACKRSVDGLVGNSLVSLNISDWSDYLKLAERYANAYAGLFLAIEDYQQDKIGQAIGLVNYSLLHLQSKKLSEISPKRSKILRLKSKFSSKKNESYIKNLESITSLSLKSSVFNESSGIILRDISYLFDQLVQLHLKLTKENDNLKFDDVVDYQDIAKTNKFPLGAKIPVSDIPVFAPNSLSKPSDEQPTRAGYY